MEKPLVSICCVIYNHAPFIRKCLDGFLMQETNFPIEILIHDDCSTDGTTEIIKEYSSKYPDLIFPLYETENQYSKPGRESMDFYNYRRAKGKYIAYCEGDDYWTDPLKLQKQVDFMETHNEYSVCFHNFKCFYVNNNTFCDAEYSNTVPLIDDECDVDNYMFFHHSYGGQPLTMLFRTSSFSFEWSKKYKGYRDTHEIYHLLKAGKGRYLNFDGGVYVKHQGGISTSTTTLQSCKIEREHILELYLQNRNDVILRQYITEILLWNYDVLKSNCSCCTFYSILFRLSTVVPEVSSRVITTIIKRKLKHLIS